MYAAIRPYRIQLKWKNEKQYLTVVTNIADCARTLSITRCVTHVHRTFLIVIYRNASYTHCSCSRKPFKSTLTRWFPGGGGTCGLSEFRLVTESRIRRFVKNKKMAKLRTRQRDVVYPVIFKTHYVYFIFYIWTFCNIVFLTIAIDPDDVCRIKMFSIESCIRGVVTSENNKAIARSFNAVVCLVSTVVRCVVSSRNEEVRMQSLHNTCLTNILSI